MYRCFLHAPQIRPSWIRVAVPAAQQPLEPLETVLGTQNVARSNGRRTGYSFLFYFIESFYLHILLHICVMPDMSPRRVVVGWAASNTNSTTTTTITGAVAVVYSFFHFLLTLETICHDFSCRYRFSVVWWLFVVMCVLGLLFSSSTIPPLLMPVMVPHTHTQHNPGPKTLALA